MVGLFLALLRNGQVNHGVRDAELWAGKMTRIVLKKNL
jgi:hypothetical protein